MAVTYDQSSHFWPETRHISDSFYNHKLFLDKYRNQRISSSIDFPKVRQIEKSYPGLTLQKGAANGAAHPGDDQEGMAK